jgi:hypothetical protein
MFEQCKILDPTDEDVDFFINNIKNNENYTAVIRYENSIHVCFYIDKDKVFTIGEKINQLHKDAYTNGYNWEAFFNYYLPKYADVIEDMESDPEASMYIAYYNLTPENEKKANKFASIIRSLIENEADLYRIIHEEGNCIV